MLVVARDWQHSLPRSEGLRWLALEQFTRFEIPQQITQRRTVWSAQLDEPLPQTGTWAEAVLALLRDVVIPNWLRNAAPGFSGVDVLADEVEACGAEPWGVLAQR